jgi:hypothetical protein
MIHHSYILQNYFACSCVKMADGSSDIYEEHYIDDHDIPLREGLDLDELRHGEGQIFEVDEDRMVDYGMSLCTVDDFIFVS